MYFAKATFPMFLTSTETESIPRPPERGFNFCPYCEIQFTKQQCPRCRLRFLDHWDEDPVTKAERKKRAREFRDLEKSEKATFPFNEFAI